jgi:hypothetical protein
MLVPMGDRGAELGTLVSVFEDAGLLKQYVNEAGQSAMRLTESQRADGRALAMSGDDGASSQQDGVPTQSSGVLPVTEEVPSRVTVPPSSYGAFRTPPPRTPAVLRVTVESVSHSE